MTDSPTTGSGAHASGESITAEGLTALEEEIAELEGPGRRTIAARIKVAREMGDLKENAEYHIAKDDQAHLETKIKRLRQRLRNAEVVEVDAGAETFAFGRTAEILDKENEEVHVWTLVGATEANLAEGRLSVESPVGQALRDQAVGEATTIETPRGERVFIIQKLVA